MMKQMEYSPNKIIEILNIGNYKGFNYYIMNLGTHPTAYIEIPKQHKIYNKTYDDIDLEVHCGLTYSRNYLYIDEYKKIKGWFIGWDYGHYGDYSGYDELLPKQFRTEGKKWTTEEILEEVKSAINKIVEDK